MPGLRLLGLQASITFSSIAFMSSSSSSAVSTNLNPPLGPRKQSALLLIRFTLAWTNHLCHIICLLSPVPCRLCPVLPQPAAYGGTPFSFCIFTNPIWMLSRANFCVRLLIFAPFFALMTGTSHRACIIAALHGAGALTRLASCPPPPPPPTIRHTPHTRV